MSCVYLNCNGYCIISSVRVVDSDGIPEGCDVDAFQEGDEYYACAVYDDDEPACEDFEEVY